MTAKLYLLDHKLKWKTFKKLHDLIVRDSGPKPLNIEKVLWEMSRDRQIYCGYRDDMPNDMWLGTEIPTALKVLLITNP